MAEARVFKFYSLVGDIISTCFRIAKCPLNGHGHGHVTF